tara:strand:+ start:511 stop:1500 length:990 start_codon:yes stop_codon:yes gene_type:complete
MIKHVKKIQKYFYPLDIYFLISDYFKRKHQSLLQKKLDKINKNFLNQISKYESVNKIISDYHMINLGVAYQRIPIFEKQLIQKGAKVTVMDGMEDFVTSDENIKTITQVISDKKNKEKFYITERQDSSSLFKLNEKFYSKYPGLKDIKHYKEVEVETLSISDLSNEEIHNHEPNYIQMQICGGELLAFKGAHESFYNKLSIISVSTHLKPYFLNAPLADEVDNFLKNLDYKKIGENKINYSHNIHVFPHSNNFSRFEDGAQKLSNYNLYAKNNRIRNQKEFLYLIFGLMIEYLYSDIWDYFELHNDLLDKEIKNELDNLFIMLRKIYKE